MDWPTKVWTLFWENNGFLYFRFVFPSSAEYLIQQSTKNDRAAQRRKEVGSSDKSEKTQVASLDANIPTENKGFKMLSKLGWSQGQKLGKNDAGLLEPVKGGVLICELIFF